MEQSETDFTELLDLIKVFLLLGEKSINLQLALNNRNNRIKSIKSCFAEKREMENEILGTDIY